jgi:hypothetical protein
MQGASTYDCALQFSVPGTPNGNVVYQQRSISAGQSGIYNYGVTLWSPDNTGSVYVQVIGRDSSGNLTDNSGFWASVIGNTRTFGGSFSINSRTTTLFFALYPGNANVGFDFSGAWIAKAP